MSQNMESSKVEKSFFEMLMANLSLNYRQKVDRKTVDWYFEHFKKYEQGKVSNAFKDVIETEEYFPTIAAIMKHLNKPHEYPEVQLNWPTQEEVQRGQKSDIGKDTFKLIRDKLSDRIDKHQYYQGILELESKYPDIEPISFKMAAEIFKRKWIDR